jgi:hypothetical protein
MQETLIPEPSIMIRHDINESRSCGGHTQPVNTGGRTYSDELGLSASEAEVEISDGSYQPLSYHHMTIEYNGTGECSMRETTYSPNPIGMAESSMYLIVTF